MYLTEPGVARGVLGGELRGNESVHYKYVPKHVRST